MSRLKIESSYTVKTKNAKLKGFDAPGNRYTWTLFSSSTTRFRILRMFKCSVCEKDCNLSKYRIIYGRNNNTRDYFEGIGIEDIGFPEESDCNEMDTQVG